MGWGDWGDWCDVLADTCSNASPIDQVCAFVEITDAYFWEDCREIHIYWETACCIPSEECWWPEFDQTVTIRVKEYWDDGTILTDEKQHTYSGSISSGMDIFGVSTGSQVMYYKCIVLLGCYCLAFNGTQSTECTLYP